MAVAAAAAATAVVAAVALTLMQQSHVQLLLHWPALEFSPPLPLQRCMALRVSVACSAPARHAALNRYAQKVDQWAQEGSSD